MKLPRTLRRLVFKSCVEQMNYRAEALGDCHAVVDLGGEMVLVSGAGTVWHDSETGERMPTWVEVMLSARWHLEKYRKEVA